MNIRTADELTDILSDEIGWRKKELINLKLLHDAAREHQADMLRRAGVALLYAHWEGFVKSAGSAYVQLVGMQRLQYDSLRSNFVAIGMKNEFSKALATSRGSVLTQIAAFFREKAGDRATLPWETAVQTKSNLSAARLYDIICLLGLDYKPFQVHEKTLIEPLLKQRNNIAHGKYLPVDRDEFSRLHSGVLNLLEEFRNQVDNAAQLGRFRIPPP